MSEYSSLSKSYLSTTISQLDSFEVIYPYIDEKMLKKICILLESLIILNMNKISENKIKKVTLFDLKGYPSISLYDYLYRIVKYTKIKDTTLIIALIYIDIIFSKNKFFITYNNIYKTLFISIILASKHYDDNYLSNRLYAKIGGIHVKELEKLENKFSKLIRFKFTLDNILINKYIKYINNDYICFNIVKRLNSI